MVVYATLTEILAFIQEIFTFILSLGSEFIYWLIDVDHFILWFPLAIMFVGYAVYMVRRMTRLA